MKNRILVNVKAVRLDDACNVVAVNADELISVLEEKLENGLVMFSFQQDGKTIEAFGTKNSKLAAILMHCEDFFKMADEIQERVEADKAKLIELINEWFTGWQFEADSDYCKIVAWRNKTVDSYNTYIRKLLFGENIPKISIGEKLFANTPIVEEEEVLFTTNEEFEVTSYSIEDFVINNGDYVLKYYKTNVKCERGGEYVLETIKILHEDSQATFTKILDYLTQTAKSLKRGSTQARETWKQFYTFKNTFASINYNYAISAHRSQGSTYVNCIIIESDLDANRKVAERNKIKYTAVTRPKNNLVIVRTEAK